MNYANVIEFVKEKIAVNGRPPNYPFRDRFEHTMRVYRWAIKLQAKLRWRHCSMMWAGKKVVSMERLEPR